MTNRSFHWLLGCACTLGFVWQLSGGQARGDDPITLATVPEAGKITADEPFAGEFSPERAARYLDVAALAWQKKYDCAACHTNMGYLFARPALRSFRSSSGEVRALFEDYATSRWQSTRPRNVQETVVVAAGLVFHDVQTLGRLRRSSRTALGLMWKYQRDDGGWTWRNDGFPPTEYDEHYGVTLAALTVGIAPENYQQSDAARRGLTRIRAFLQEHPPLSLHHRMMLAWVSCYVEGVVDEQQRETTLEQVFRRQRPDGGWSTPGLLADWRGLKRLDGKPHDPLTSDAYATGFALILARELGISAADPRLQRGVQWLLGNQRVSGKWFCRSPAKDSHHYFTNLGTAFAVLALQACDRLPGWPLGR